VICCMLCGFITSVARSFLVKFVRRSFFRSGGARIVAAIDLFRKQDQTKIQSCVKYGILIVVHGS
jgi:hypothetical protein